MFCSITIICIPSIVLLVSIFLWGEGVAFEISSIICGIILFTVLLIIPIQRLCINSGIKEFQSIQQTIDSQREFKKKGYENAALITKIIEANKWLASAKYYRKLFKAWNPKEIERLQPIK